MKLEYISSQKRRYVSLGKQFPNKESNEVEVDDSLGDKLLGERAGIKPLWAIVKPKKKAATIEEVKEEE